MLHFLINCQILFIKKKTIPEILSEKNGRINKLIRFSSQPINNQDPFWNSGEFQILRPLIVYCTHIYRGLPGGPMVKNLHSNAGDPVQSQ